VVVEPERDEPAAEQRPAEEDQNFPHLSPAQFPSTDNRRHSPLKKRGGMFAKRPEWDKTE
jgi:hypothetical protein